MGDNVEDNVDKRRGVRDIRSDHHGQLKHLKSRVQGPSPPAPAPSQFIPCDISKDQASMYQSDVKAIKSNLVVLVS